MTGQPSIVHQCDTVKGSVVFGMERMMEVKRGDQTEETTTGTTKLICKVSGEIVEGRKF